MENQPALTNPVVITTHIVGDHAKGTARVLYRWAYRHETAPTCFVWSARSYSTPAGARKAARKQGFTNILRTGANGWHKNRPLDPAWLTIVADQLGIAEDE